MSLAKELVAYIAALLLVSVSSQDLYIVPSLSALLSTMQNGAPAIICGIEADYALSSGFSVDCTGSLAPSRAIEAYFSSHRDCSSLHTSDADLQQWQATRCPSDPRFSALNCSVKAGSTTGCGRGASSSLAPALAAPSPSFCLVLAFSSCQEATAKDAVTCKLTVPRPEYGSGNSRRRLQQNYNCGTRCPYQCCDSFGRCGDWFCDTCGIRPGSMCGDKSGVPPGTIVAAVAVVGCSVVLFALCCCYRDRIRRCFGCLNRGGSPPQASGVAYVHNGRPDNIQMGGAPYSAYNPPYAYPTQAGYPVPSGGGALSASHTWPEPAMGQPAMGQPVYSYPVYSAEVHADQLASTAPLQPQSPLSQQYPGVPAASLIGASTSAGQQQQQQYPAVGK